MTDYEMVLGTFIYLMNNSSINKLHRFLYWTNLEMSLKILLKLTERGFLDVLSLDFLNFESYWTAREIKEVGRGKLCKYLITFD